jgi:hypothetical protein
MCYDAEHVDKIWIRRMEGCRQEVSDAAAGKIICTRRYARGGSTKVRPKVVTFEEGEQQKSTDGWVLRQAR